MSAGNVVQWNWDFGDGHISNERNPLHFYQHAGDTVSICLTTVTADSCKSNYCAILVVGSHPVPFECTTDFTIGVGKSLPPVYQFIPDSMDEKGSYFWDFGDGSVSGEISPMHRYEYGGNYNVCLTKTTDQGCMAYACKVLQATGYSNECHASWTAYGDILMDPTEPASGDTLYTPLARYYYFQDQSKGLVTAWHWSFGDGSESTEQNPSHQFKENGVYAVCLEITTSDSCSSSLCDSLYVGVVPYCSLTGTVEDYTGLDGCGLLIRLDNGEVIEPAEIVPDFVLKNGQRVQLAYTELTDRASICMAGKIVRIDCIQEISPGYCVASLTYYPLSAVSSLPPIYQFNDISGIDVLERQWDFGDGVMTREWAPMHRYEYSGYYTVCLTIFTADNCSATSCETAYFEGADSQTVLCDNFIRLSTEMILNGQTCNGSATASLVDASGMDVYAGEFLWSTGETGPTVQNLCPGITYSVIITDSSGCAVSGSFAFGGNVIIPDSVVGFWNYEQDDNSFIFNIPVYSDSVYCKWEFGDGESATGSSVSHTYEGDETYHVALRVYDLNGNLLYTQEIPVNPGSPTGTGNHGSTDPEVFPVPASDILYIKPGERYADLVTVEILSSNGQVLVLRSFDGEAAERTVEMNLSSLRAGFYVGRLTYSDGTRSQFRVVK
jgi:PKD repeat protein